jgi:hypothetical protein
VRGPPGRWRHRRGRPPCPKRLLHSYRRLVYVPAEDVDAPERVVLAPEEVEALRLVYLEEMSYEEAGRAMGVSRSTVWRLVESAGRKIAYALVNGLPIELQGQHDDRKV